MKIVVTLREMNKNFICFGAICLMDIQDLLYDYAGKTKFATSA